MRSPVARLARSRALLATVALAGVLVAVLAPASAPVVRALGSVPAYRNDAILTAPGVSGAPGASATPRASLRPSTTPLVTPGSTSPPTSASTFGDAGPAVIAMVVVALVALLGGWWIAGRNDRSRQGPAR